MTGSKGPPLGVCLWGGVHFELKILLNTHVIIRLIRLVILVGYHS